MKNKITEEINRADDRKIVLGLRCYPELKHKLSLEASALGLSVSEHSENLLLNSPRLILENENLRKDLADRKAASKHQESALGLKIMELQSTVENRTAENKRLLEEVSLLKQQTVFFREKRLLELLDRLKGHKQIIQMEEGGSIEVTYETVIDVLTVMIYSFKTKKP